jgi:hypothetical protein
MDKVREYRKRATECRVAAARASTPDLQSHFQDMAAIWERLADERITFFVGQPAPNGADNTVDGKSSR